MNLRGRNPESQKPRKETIGDEVEYCQKEILDAILKSKTIFDELEVNTCIGHILRKSGVQFFSIVELYPGENTYIYK